MGVLEKLATSFSFGFGIHCLKYWYFKKEPKKQCVCCFVLFIETCFYKFDIALHEIYFPHWYSHRFCLPYYQIPGPSSLWQPDPCLIPSLAACSSWPHASPSSRLQFLPPSWRPEVCPHTFPTTLYSPHTKTYTLEWWKGAGKGGVYLKA